jgi:type IV pilus secretin PilQ/predicted competence protein
MRVNANKRLAQFLVFAFVSTFALAAPASTAETERLITLNAEDADLPRVLALLAERGGLNLITGPGVTSERVSVRMKDVPVDQAVNLVVRAAGLAYERIGNSIVVADAKALKEETGLSSYVLTLKYADAKIVKAALVNVAPDIQIDQGGNRMIVVTSPRVISEIQKIVDVIDQPARQVQLEARIIEVGTDDLKRLGIDWSLLNQQRWVFIEGRADSATTYQQIPDQAPWYQATPGTPDLNKLRNFSRQAMAFNVALDLLIRDGNARVLANPKLTTLNGREASILIGTRIPFVITGTAFAGGGAAPVQKIEKEEVGVKLRITPLINADGYITTEISPEVSTVIGFAGENSDLPIVSTRQASTTVRLKDGNSVVIGGLLSEDKTTTRTRVPILGDIPGIGLLFQHQTITNSKKDLVIEVTPRILTEPQ